MKRHCEYDECCVRMGVTYRWLRVQVLYGLVPKRYIRLRLRHI